MENELYHHGVKGQRWGVRRYQNKDGSLTYAGKKRALKMQDQYTNFTEDKKYRKKDGSYTLKGRKKALKMKEKYSELTGKDLKKYPQVKKTEGEKKKSFLDMTDDELRSTINRMRMESDYVNLKKQLSSVDQQKVSKGKAFVKNLVDEVIAPPLKNVGRQYLEKALKDASGLNDKKSKSEYDILKEEVDLLDLKKRKKDNIDYLSKNDSTRKRIEEKRMLKEEADIDDYMNNRNYRRDNEARKQAALNSTYAKTAYQNWQFFEEEKRKRRNQVK